MHVGKIFGVSLGENELLTRMIPRICLYIRVINVYRHVTYAPECAK